MNGLTVEINLKPAIQTLIMVNILSESKLQIMTGSGTKKVPQSRL